MLINHSFLDLRSEVFIDNVFEIEPVGRRECQSHITQWIQTTMLYIPG